MTMYSDSSVCPPNPSDAEEQYIVAGQRLQVHVRSLEKKQQQDGKRSDLQEAENDRSTGNVWESSDRNVKNMLELLQYLIPLVARNGLFCGLPVEIGDTNQKKEASSKATSNKRGSDSSRLVFVTGGDKDESKSRISACADQIISSVVRIMGWQNPDSNLVAKSIAGLDPDDRCLLIMLSSDLCAAVANYVRERHALDFAGEFELLSSNAKSLLVGLTNSMDYILDTSSCSSENTVIFPIDQPQPLVLKSLISCQRVAVNLVSLLYPHLSRFSSQMQQLLVIGVWKSFSVVDQELVETATLLNATIQTALAAGAVSPNNHVSDAEDPWTKSLRESVALLFVFLQEALPINPRLGERAQEQDYIVQHALGKAATTVWLQKLRETNSEEERSRLLLHCVEVLVSMSKNLLSVDTRDVSYLLGAHVDVALILDLVEILICFPISAESLYFRTKKRLRREPMVTGYFSPAATASICNSFKVMGHGMLNRLLSSLGRPLLLPFSRRLRTICFASLLTASSTKLRNVCEDKVSISISDPAKKRWLNASIAVRTKVLRSIQKAFVVVGIDASPLSKSLGVSKQSDDLDRLITLICGCIVEQLEWFDRPQENVGDWGTFKERLEEMVAAGDCLGVCLVSGGQFLSIVARSLIDSTAKSILNKCVTIRRENLHDFSSLFKCALSLGINACSAPYRDGAASTVGVPLRDTAERLLRTTSDEPLMCTALAAIRICDTIDAPRVPALSVVTRKPMSTTSSHNIANVYQLQSLLDKQGPSVDEMNAGEDDSTAKRRKLDPRKSEEQVQTGNLTAPPQASTTKGFQKEQHSKTKAPDDDTEEEAKATNVEEDQEVKDTEMDIDSQDVRQPESLHPPSTSNVLNDAEPGNAESNNTETVSKDVPPYLESSNVISRTSKWDSSYKPTSTVQSGENDSAEEEEDDIPMIFDAPPDEDDE